MEKAALVHTLIPITPAPSGELFSWVVLRSFQMWLWSGKSSLDKQRLRKTGKVLHLNLNVSLLVSPTLSSRLNYLGKYGLVQSFVQRSPEDEVDFVVVCLPFSWNHFCGFPRLWECALLWFSFWQEHCRIVRGLMDGSVGRSVSLPLCSRLKCLNNYEWDCSVILYLHGPTEAESNRLWWFSDLFSGTTWRSKFSLSTFTGFIGTNSSQIFMVSTEDEENL